jgi:glycosyltransferase involved in cell wall biosynthesis
MIVGGAQENTLLSAEGLDRLPGYDVDLVSGVDRGAEGDMLDRAGQSIDLFIVPEMRRNVNPLADAIALWKLYALLRRGHYHIVHTHLAKAGILGRLAAWLARTPIVVHSLHGLVFHDYQPWIVNRAVWAAQLLCRPMTDHYVSVSSVVSEKAIAAGIVAAEDVTTIYSGMELDWFLDASYDAARERSELGIPGDAPVVGMIARMVPVKNHVQLFEAMPGVIARHPYVRFLLVGDGPLLEGFRERAWQMGIEDQVVFTGLVPRERIPGLIATMDVLAHTALYEGLPRVLVQALAMGKPCVAFDADGAREVIIPGETGFLLQSGDTGGVVDAINALLADGTLREQMGAAGRRRVDPDFRAETMVQRIDEVYQMLLRQYPRRVARLERRLGRVPRLAS